MKNKLISGALALCLASTVNASSFFDNEDKHYKQFREEVAKFFDENGAFSIPYKQYKINFSNTYPKMNIFEDKKSYIFKFELAGIEKKDISVTITNQNILTISGAKKEFTKKEKSNIVRQEQHYGSFKRSLSLPDDIDSKSIKVSHKNGILKVTVNKDVQKIKNKVRTLQID